MNASPANLLRDYRCSFHHIGIACRDLDAEATAWTMLGYEPEGPDFADPIQKVRGRFLAGPGPRLELLSPLIKGSPIDGMIDRGVKMYHQAFMTPVFDEALAGLRMRGCRIVAGPAPAVAFQGRRIVFLILANLNVIELIEEGSTNDH